MTQNITRRNFLGASGGAALLAGCGSGDSDPVQGETLIRELDARPRYGADLAFQHGVASGDPDQTSVVIWTRVTPLAEAGDVIPVSYGVFLDAQAETPVAFGIVKAERYRDFCVKAVVENLKPDTQYYFRFVAKAAEKDIGSTMGRTRTLPEKTQSVTFAAVSCSHYGFGHFNAYRALADDESIQFILHLGDYIYEYGPDGYGGKEGAALGRLPEPLKEITTLADYRTRYAHYRSDPDLQAAHATHPWICSWDDHECANDSWAEGAKNHSPDEGPWIDRKGDAIQAYLDWMPIRETENLSTEGMIYRSVELGDIATLICLETRLTGRSEMIQWETALKDVPMEQVPFKIGGIMNKVLDESRTQLGQTQEKWLDGEVTKSVKQGKAWQVLANQTIMATARLPDLSKMVTEADVAENTEPVGRSMIPFSRLGLPYNLDAWDGFPAARERLYDSFAKHDEARLVTLTGDSHSAWVNQLTDKSGAVRGVEFASTSITSPSIGRFFPSIPDLGPAFVEANPDVKWHKSTGHGYCRLTFTKTEASAQFVEVSTIKTTEFTVSIAQTAQVPRDKLGDIRLG